MQALILEYENCKILLINTYFPCDSQKLVLSDSEAAELQTLLTNISSLKHKYANKFDTAFILGDINYDNLRYTGHTIAVNNFLDLRDCLQFGISFLLTSHSLLGVLILLWTTSSSPPLSLILYWKLGQSMTLRICLDIVQFT